jgi:ubiquinone/menaquinone biosynthesis C-methylase UbiE
LRRLGVADLPRSVRIVELFCGRGNGPEALARLGFRNLEGVDLSPRLIAQYKGSARCYVADCRYLPFADGSRDVVIVQGGLHHLMSLPDDLAQVLAEVRRVLRDEGKLVVVEPWLTPFLRLVHLLCGFGMVRKFSGKLDALATMIQYERKTYEQWLGQPGLVRSTLQQYFEPTYLSTRWGTCSFVGAPRRQP